MVKTKIVGALQKLYEGIEQNKMLQCIRDGLVMIVPILFVGAFSLGLRNLPIEAYQNIIQNLFGGILVTLFDFLYNATLGMLAVYCTFSISISYAKIYLSTYSFSYGTTLASLMAFFIFSGVLQKDINFSIFGTSGLFTAIVCALGASSLYCFFEKNLFKNKKFYTDGADQVFNKAMNALTPVWATAIVFSILYMIMVNVFEVTGFQMLFSNIMNFIFGNMGRTLSTMIFFVFSTNFLWFFGIHGNNALEEVAQNIFVPAIEINQQLIASGGVATEIFSKTFMDVFALMGGTGNTISLLLALFVWGKGRNNKKLASYSMFPMIFNINEILVLGLPVVLNPFLLIPYILVPIVLVIFSTFVIQIGWVPIPINSVTWTTPFLLSGYLATGSIAGSILQIVNIIIGMLIYCPFLKLYDAMKMNQANKALDHLIQILQESEETDSPVELLGLHNAAGGVAKNIVSDMKYRLKNEAPRLFYQPQFDDTGRCIGAEALLRWTHPIYGNIYPPLIVKLAGEAGVLRELEEGVFCSAIKDMDKVLDGLVKDSSLSINVTGATIKTQEFEDFLLKLKEQHPEKISQICVEITEQCALKLDDELMERLTRIHAMGYILAIDDFSMGSTSIKYLQTNVFDLVKLDGALSRDIMDNTRSRDIVESIAKLTDNLGIQILAEYVETKEQQKLLKSIGCQLYQGYLYSPALPIEKFNSSIEQIQNKQERN